MSRTTVDLDATVLRELKRLQKRRGTSRDGFDVSRAMRRRPRTPVRAVARRHVRPLGELDGFCEVYRRTTREVVVRGNLVPDAHLAALLLQHGVTTLWAHDRDFRKFEGTRVRDPIDDNDR